MKQLKFKLNDCSSEKLQKLAKQCGFTIKEGAKHCKVIDANGIKITQFPRHTRLDKYLVKGVINRFNMFGADITYPR